MSTHQDWSTAAFDLAPIAPQIGPFSSRSWLRSWWNQRGVGELMLADTGDSLLPLTLDADRLEFAGEADLTDYHSPLGRTDVSALSKLVTDLAPGTTLILDSLPEQAAARVADALEAAGCVTATKQHTVAAVLALPDSFEAYLAGLAKKERHELRRKRRRFDNELGAGTVQRRTGPEAVSLFARLHRLSAGDKGAFMTEEMEAFFLALHEDAGGVIDVLVDGSGRPASAVFSFEDATGFYLYNSAFEPELRQHSPGNVMLSHLIEQAIAKKLQVFDFLKGDEPYKYRLGATPRPLFVVTTTVGRSS